MSETLRLAALQAAEIAINQALHLDPASRTRLLALLQQPLEVRLSAPAMTVYLLSAGERLCLLRETGESAGVQVEGTPLAFLALASGDRDTLRDGRIRLEGDAEQARALQQTFDQLELDWEGALASVIGDIPAHFLGRRVRDSLRWAQQARQRLMQNVEEYVREESQHVPPRAQAEDFFDQIDELLLATDRLSARVERLARQADADRHPPIATETP